MPQGIRYVLFHPSRFSMGRSSEFKIRPPDSLKTLPTSFRKLPEPIRNSRDHSGRDRTSSESFRRRSGPVRSPSGPDRKLPGHDRKHPGPDRTLPGRDRESSGRPSNRSESGFERALGSRNPSSHDWKGRKLVRHQQGLLRDEKTSHSLSQYL